MLSKDIIVISPPQVYQWYETEDGVSAGREAADSHVEKSYSYDTDWLDHHVDSSNFAHTLGMFVTNRLFQGWHLISGTCTQSKAKKVNCHYQLVMINYPSSLISYPFITIANSI